MSLSVFQFGLFAAGIVFLIGGATLAFFAARISVAGRTALAEAESRLAASEEYAAEVRRLVEKVEQSLAARDAAVENAFLRHNEACMASVNASMAAKASDGHGHGHDDDDDDDHKKHHSSMSDGHHDDDDDDDDHKKHHAANDEAHRPSFFARLFRRQS